MGWIGEGLECTLLIKTWYIITNFGVILNSKWEREGQSTSILLTNSKIFSVQNFLPHLGPSSGGFNYINTRFEIMRSNYKPHFDSTLENIVNFVFHPPFLYEIPVRCRIILISDSKSARRITYTLIPIKSLLMFFREGCMIKKFNLSELIYHKWNGQ